jgi:pyruvate kinase
MKRDIHFARTKIIGTLGPASHNPEVLTRMISAGLDVVRLNCSHSGPEELEQSIRLVRDVSESCSNPVSILADLGGPKIRLAKLPADIPVTTGQIITLTADGDYKGTDKIPAGYPELAEDLKKGNRILIDDGLVQLEVIGVKAPDIECRILNDGVLKSRKGINLPGVDISLPSLTDKDRKDIDFLVTQPIDYIALSFVRSRKDIRELRNLLESKGRNIPIIAKIEKPEAVADLEGIVAETDMVMVARGDLGVEMPTEDVPIIQKRIIAECNRQNKPVITATQMLDSMITNPRPTRAEASDVANAVFDGTDAVMLSGETSVGHYPVECVGIMDEIVRAAENHRTISTSGLQFRRLDNMSYEESICHSACLMAEESNAAAIICLTNRGRTARLLSRFRSSVPVIAFTERMDAVLYLNIIWGVQGEIIDNVKDTDSTLDMAAKLAENLGYIKKGDTVVFTAGIPLIESPHTNMLKIVEV